MIHEDKERLDFLEQMLVGEDTDGAPLQVVCRDSSRGTGLRLHEIRGSTAHYLGVTALVRPTVREAIDAAIEAAKGG